MTEGRKISELLMKGKANAMTGKAIAALLGVEHRTVTKMIEAERREGAAICANCSPEQEQQGYYLADTPEELEEYLGILKHRAIEILKTRQAVLKRGKAIEQERTK